MNEESAVQPRLRLYTVPELLELPDPQWLIQDYVEEGALAVVYGPSGHGKSFLVIDWALSIATNQAWQERAVRGGPVLYVLAEGQGGLKKRVAAWMKERGGESIDRALFMLEPVQPHEAADLTLLRARLQSLNMKPKLIVLDTLARCAVGIDENSAKEMGTFIRGVQCIQQDHGCAVIPVHHTGKPGQDGSLPKLERGSSALRAAADAMIHVVLQRDVLIVSCDKQKDDEQAKPLKLRLKQVPVGFKAGKPLASCVLVHAEEEDSADTFLPPSHLRKTLSALEALPGREAASGAWERASGLKERTYQEHRKRLLNGGWIEEVAAGSSVYRLTAAGATAAIALRPQQPETTAMLSAATAHPPKGVQAAAAAADDQVH